MTTHSVELVIPWGWKMNPAVPKRPFNELCKKLDSLIEKTDGVRCGITGYGNKTTSYEILGEDADDVFALFERLLTANELARRSKVFKRYGSRKNSAFVRLQWKSDQWREVASQGTKPKPRRPVKKKVKKPTVKEARRLASLARSDYREKGLRMLLELGRRDEVAKLAMDEPDSGLVSRVLEWLYPAPADLVVRYVTMSRGPDSVGSMRFTIGQTNYLYAQDALADAHRGRKKKMHPTVIEGAGMAYCQSFAPLLEPLVDAEVYTLEHAVLDYGKRETKRDELGTLEMDAIWSYETHQ